MVDWIIGQVRELNLQPTSSSWRLRGCANITVAQRLNYLTTWLVFWSWPVSIRNHLLSINSDVVQRPTVNNKDTPHHWGNSKNLVFPQGTGDKCQSRVLLYNSWILQLPKKLFKEMSMPGSHQEFSFNWSGVQPEYKDFSILLQMMLTLYRLCCWPLFILWVWISRICGFLQIRLELLLYLLELWTFYMAGARHLMTMS